jgi:mRNA-degrading endonuclease RelE of RelBE toxin-antitoxin system
MNYHEKIEKYLMELLNQIRKKAAKMVENLYHHQPKEQLKKKLRKKHDNIIKRWIHWA